MAGSSWWPGPAESDLLFGLLLPSIDCRLNASVANGPGNAAVAFVPAMSNKVDCHQRWPSNRYGESANCPRILHAYLQQSMSNVCVYVCMYKRSRTKHAFTAFSPP